MNEREAEIGYLKERYREQCALYPRMARDVSEELYVRVNLPASELVPDALACAQHMEWRRRADVQHYAHSDQLGHGPQEAGQ